MTRFLDDLSTFLIKSIFVLFLFALPSLVFANSLPAHQPNGWRDTGCDINFRTEVRSKVDGRLLYTNNPTCPMVTPGGENPEVDEEDHDEDHDEGPVCKGACTD